MSVKIFVWLLATSVLIILMIGLLLLISISTISVYDSGPAPLSFWVSNGSINIHTPSPDIMIQYCSENHGDRGIRYDHQQSGGYYISTWYCP